MRLTLTCLVFITSRLETHFWEHFSLAASERAEAFWASEPEADVCVRPVLEERPGQRGRQEQEVLLSQRETPVSLCNPGEPPLLSASFLLMFNHLLGSGGPKTNGWCSSVPMRGKSGRRFDRSRPKNQSQSSLRYFFLYISAFFQIPALFSHSREIPPATKPLPPSLLSPDLHARDGREEVRLHRELHVCT